MYRIRLVVLLVLLLATIARADDDAPLTEFDAGKTFVLQPGRTLRVELVRTAAEMALTWRWVRVDERVVTWNGVERRPENGGQVEVHTFTAIAPGTINLHAELVAADAGASPRKRYPITVQVVPAE